MNGPEHYRTAENLLSGQRSAPRGTAEDRSVLAEAQVHATLALAAAVGALDSFAGPIDGYATGRLDRAEWEVVTAKDSVKS